MTQYLDTPQGRRLAYDRLAGDGPGVVFLGGFASDRSGTKATALEAWARSVGRAFLRFDYSGHGDSDGRFDEGTIGRWAADASEVLKELTTGPQILVGSSMGGWIATLIARDAPDRVAALVGIAAAPDFTEDAMWAGFTDDQRRTLRDAGRIQLPSEYDAPLTVTAGLIADGRDHLVLRRPLRLGMPVRLLQGTADADVETATALRLLDHIEGDDVRLTLVKDADHRFSTPACLDLVTATITAVGRPPDDV